MHPERESSRSGSEQSLAAALDSTLIHIEEGTPPTLSVARRSVGSAPRRGSMLELPIPEETDQGWSRSSNEDDESIEERSEIEERRAINNRKYFK